MSETPKGAEVPLRLDGGGDGWAHGLEGLVVALVVPRPFAPGAPLALTAWPEDDAPLWLEGRTVGAKKRADGRFDVRVRLVNLRRDARERLALALTR